MIEIHCRYDELLPIHEVKFHPKNRNSHPKDQIERLAEILKYQGWRYPIKISNLSGCIVSGHGRVLAARLLGLDTVPVQRQDYETEEQEYADLISDNSIASWSELDLSSINSDIVDLGPDFNIDLLGIKDFVVEPIDKLEPQCDEDEVPDALTETKVVQGEVYILGNHRLMCGDSTSIDDVERLMDGKKADMVFTDPPYDLPDQEDYSFTVKNFSKDSHVFIMHDDRGIVSYLRKSTLNFQRFFVANFQFSSPRGNDPYLQHILISHEKNGNAASHNNLYDGFSSIVKLEYRHRLKDEKTAHKHQKPVEFISKFLLHYSKNLVLDIFLGSGTTLISCEKTGRICYGMELSPQYVDLIIDRWQKFTGKKAHREDGMLWDEIKGE